MDRQVYRLEGFQEFEDQLRELAKSYRGDTIARRTLVKAAMTAMKPVEDMTRQIAPYDSSSNKPIHLRNTVRLDARIPNGRDKMSDYVSLDDAAIAVVSVKKSAVSLAQEFGTKDISPQPFLRPSLQRQANSVLSILKTELARIIPEYAASLRRKK